MTVEGVGDEEDEGTGRTSIDVKCCEGEGKSACQLSSTNELPQKPYDSLSAARPTWRAQGADRLSQIQEAEHDRYSGRTRYSGRCETSFRLCTWIKCARKYSETSSKLFGLSPYDEMLHESTTTRRRTAEAIAKTEQARTRARTSGVGASAVK